MEEVSGLLGGKWTTKDVREWGCIGTEGETLGSHVVEILKVVDGAATDFAGSLKTRKERSSRIDDDIQLSEHLRKDYAVEQKAVTSPKKNVVMYSDYYEEKDDPAVTLGQRSISLVSTRSIVP
ncbi:Protein of unknown function [Gryllus bimaculatus]|nr:Protein of unknown function [Gryllus bimaculatus]